MQAEEEDEDGEEPESAAIRSSLASLKVLFQCCGVGGNGTGTIHAGYCGIGENGGGKQLVLKILEMKGRWSWGGQCQIYFI